MSPPASRASGYTFGHTLEEQTSKVVQAAGGRVLGSVRHPIGTDDFSSFLLRAQASGAKVIALANGGTDTINSIKQAREFGLTGPGGAVLPGLTVVITDLPWLRPAAAQSKSPNTSLFLDPREESRAWAEEVFAV